MKRPCVAMIVGNSVRSDPRVCREAEVLVNAGYDVHLFGIDQGMEAPARWQWDKAPVHLVGSTDYCSRLVDAPRLPRPRRVLRVANSCLPLLARHVRALRVLLITREQVRALLLHDRNISQLAPIVVHGHDLAGGVAAARIASHIGATLIYDAHELYPDMGGFPPWYRMAVRYQEGRVARQAATVFTVSPGIVRIIARRYGCIPELLLNVPDGQLISPRPHEGPYRILYHGGLVPGRNVLLLPEWVKRAHNRCGCTITILAFGPLRSALAKTIQEAGLDSICRLGDPVAPAELPRLSADYDFGLIPFEGHTLNNRLCLPNKLFEYMAAGLAILSNVELQEVAQCISGEHIGVTFDAKRPDGLADALAQLPSRSVVEGMRTCSHIALRDKYNWKTCADVLRSTYRSFAPIAE
jgi:glycosyltransferase involved in cell wall biosynthesis